MPKKEETNVLNVRQKLAKARLDFLESGIQKSGKHLKLEFTYFELKDIVPTATKIFYEVGLTSNFEVDQNEGTATMTILDTDNMENEGIKFTVPWVVMGQIVSKSGNAVTNPVQSEGSSLTYLRRYLYMLALDISEPDTIEPTLMSDEEMVAAQNRSVPATTEERAEIKKELVSNDANASEAMIEDLKKVCKRLLEKDDSQEEFVQKIAMKTDGFTRIPTSACETLISNIEQMLAEYQE